MDEKCFLLSNFFKWCSSTYKVLICLISGSYAPVCGNQLLDHGEECDCGFQDSCVELNDSCCYPGDFENASLRCKLKDTVQCR